MNRRLTIKLNDPTKEGWACFKKMHNSMVKSAAQYNVELTDCVWDDVNYIKSITYRSYSKCELMNFMSAVSLILHKCDLSATYLKSDDMDDTRGILNRLKEVVRITPTTELNPIINGNDYVEFKRA